MWAWLERVQRWLFRTEAEVETVATPPTQRRRATRMPCRYSVECISGGKKFSGMIRDISLTGMRVDLPRAVPVGTEIAVRYRVSADAPRFTNVLSLDTVMGRVVWSRTGMGGSAEVGLCHIDEEEDIAHSWIYHVLRELGLSKVNVKERRKYPRIRCLREGRLGDAHGMILDLSEDGCQVECTMGMRDGTRVRLHLALPSLPPLNLEGRTVHSRKLEDGRVVIGVQFAALSNREVIRLRRYLVALVSQPVLAATAR